MNPAPDFFTGWRPHWTSELCGSDYMEFRTKHGISGLAQVDNDKHLDLLFVGSDNPGTGQFRLFIDDAKTRFASISIWIIIEPALTVALTKYGFIPCNGSSPTLDGTSTLPMRGMRWEKIS